MKYIIKHPISRPKVVEGTFIGNKLKKLQYREISGGGGGTATLRSAWMAKWTPEKQKIVDAWIKKENKWLRWSEQARKQLELKEDNYALLEDSE